MAVVDRCRWLLVVKEDGKCSVVNVRSVVNNDELRIGQEVTVANRRGATYNARLMSASDDRKNLEQQSTKLNAGTAHAAAKNSSAVPPAEGNGPNLYEDPEPEDFSPSASSWGPGSQCASDSNGEEYEVPIEVEPRKSTLKEIKHHYGNKKCGKNPRTPTLRAHPVLPNTANGKHRKRSTTKNTNEKPTNDNLHDRSHVIISVQELVKVKNDINNFQNVLKSLKESVSSIRSSLTADYLYETKFATPPTEPSEPSSPLQHTRGHEVPLEVTREDVENIPVETPRDTRPIQVIKPIRYGHIKHNSSRPLEASCSNVTAVKPRINTSAVANSTKVKSYSNPRVSKERQSQGTSNGSGNQYEDNQGMVPIGSGKTFVPKAIWTNIKWDSYTMATRKLLMAVFPRKTLATHSLTGKVSPAFTDRPAKLCLDQKKVQDIILTVVDKCKVKDSLVRSAITTKCADENKMMRMQQKKSKRNTISGPLRMMNADIEHDRRNTADSGNHNQTT